MTTKSNGRNGKENNDEKNAIIRIEKLMQLSFRLLKPSNDSNSPGTESAYKRRGIVLKHIPHSSVKVAKEFDDSI